MELIKRTKDYSLWIDDRQDFILKYFDEAAGHEFAIKVTGKYKEFLKQVISE